MTHRGPGASTGGSAPPASGGGQGGGRSRARTPRPTAEHPPKRGEGKESRPVSRASAHSGPRGPFFLIGRDELPPAVVGVGEHVLQVLGQVLPIGGRDFERPAVEADPPEPGDPLAETRL